MFLLGFLAVFLAVIGAAFIYVGWQIATKDDAALQGAVFAAIGIGLLWLCMPIFQYVSENTEGTYDHWKKEQREIEIREQVGRKVI